MKSKAKTKKYDYFDMEYDAAKVCDTVAISVYTLDRWYAWYRKQTPETLLTTPILPPYTLRNGRRMWKRSDMKKLQAFKEWVPRGRNGIMSTPTQKRYNDKIRDRKKAEKHDS